MTAVIDDPAASSRTADEQVVVAIDGPSGSGKSSVSRAVATRLEVGYLDTGAMYRALTWWCLERGLDLSDQDAVAVASRELPLVMSHDPQEPAITVDGTAVDLAIRETRISEAVSAVATNLAVRADMKQRQRALIGEIASATGGVVAEGRDITTVVAPDADVRILLTASEAARLARRSKELHGSDDDSSLERTREQVVARDAKDSTVSQFSVAADGVVTVDTSDLDFEQSVQAVLDVVRAGVRAG